MTVDELFSVQTDSNILKSLYIELANHENFNPYKKNIIFDMPRSGRGKDFNEWYVEEKERIEKDIEFYKDKLQRDRKTVDEYINACPFPECDIVRYRVINNLGWYEIGDLLGMDRRTASRKFYNCINLPALPARKC